MIIPKKLVRAVFEMADLPRLPFIPWVFTHAARLEQVPVRRIFTDPTQYTKCLQNAQRLYCYDAIISSFDSTLEMELCGCPIKWRGDYETPATSPNPGFDPSRLQNINIESTDKTARFSTVLESLRRINRVAGQNLALFAVVTGPLTLAAGLTGRDPIKDLTERPEEAIRTIDATTGFLLKVVQAYCQLEIDIIAISERLMAVFPPGHLSWLRSVFSPILNMVRFYNAFSILLPGQSTPENIASLLDLGFDGIVAAGIDTNSWQKIKRGRSCILGKAIPTGLLNSGTREIQAYLETFLPERIEPGVFLTTDWEVLPETPPDNIHLVTNIISKHY